MINDPPLSFLEGIPALGAGAGALPFPFVEVVASSVAVPSFFLAFLAFFFIVGPSATVGGGGTDWVGVAGAIAPRYNDLCVNGYLSEPHKSRRRVSGLQWSGRGA